MGMGSREEDDGKHCEQVRNASKEARDAAAEAVAHAQEIRAKIGPVRAENDSFRSPHLRRDQ
jgi:hypothetical protein